MTRDGTDPANTTLDSGPAIAVVGMAGRFPGAQDIDVFWRNLVDGVETVRAIPKDALISSGRRPEEINAPDFVAAESALDDIDRFDAAFFGVAPRDAALLDPQLRHMLETAWHVFENAGTDPYRSGARSGVFAAANISTYWLINLAASFKDVDPTALIEHVVGNGQDYPATWIAYKLGLTGPALNVLTACSSGLAVVASACQNLADYSCDRALAIAGSIAVPQGRGYIAHAGSIHSPDGQCRPFDARANGTVVGDGVAGVLLRRLEDAEAEGDRIMAVIRGWAMNNDGSRKAGYAAPSVEGQAEVLDAAAALAGIAPGDLDYIEAHGTGTELGDPIEFAALARIHGQAADPAARCGLGAVKSALGHLETAAGMAGFIKTVLALRQGVMPPTLHFRTPNPRLSLDGTPFFIVDSPTPFPERERPRRAAVSSFGFGGTNVHVVLEAAEVRSCRPVRAEGPEVMVLSARDEPALDRLRKAWSEWLWDTGTRDEGPDAATLAEIADTALDGRAALPWRLAVAGTERMEIASALDAADLRLHARKAPATPRLCFVFPGQGVPIGRSTAALMRLSPAFSETLAECDMVLGRLGRPAISEWLVDSEADLPVDPIEEDRSHIANFCFAIAMTALLRGLGIEPAAVIGHSAGEATALTAAGGASLEEAIAFLTARAEAFRLDVPEGAMLAVALDAKTLAPRLQAAKGRPRLWIAGENGPAQSVVAGEVAAVVALADALVEEKVPHRRLPIGRAGHTPLMAGAASRIEAAARFRPPRLPMISTVTGRIEDSRFAEPYHWSEQLVTPVRFADTIEAAAAAGCTGFVELTPRPVFAVVGRSVLRAAASDAHWISAIDDDGDTEADEAVALAIARLRGQLFLAGHTSQPLRPRANRRARLPLYPFADKRYWVDTPAASAGPSVAQPAADPVATTMRLPTDNADMRTATTADTQPDPLLDFVSSVWAERLGLASVGPDEDFFALGGTSLGAIQILNAIESVLEVRLPMTAFAKNRTPRALAAEVAALLADHRKAAEPSSAGARA